MSKTGNETPGRVARALLIAAVVFLLAMVGATIGSRDGYRPEVMAYWLQAFGTIGAIIWAIWNAQRTEKLDQRRRLEQTRSEIGSLAYDVTHFIARNVEAMQHHPSTAHMLINGSEFSELLQRMTAVRQLPLDPQEKDDIITLRSNLVDSITVVDHYREHGKLSHDDYGLLEGYQREVKQVLDRRNADRRMFRP